MRAIRYSLPVAVMSALVVLATLSPFAVTACSKNTRTTTINDTFKALVVARDTFVVWDKAHQEAVAASATSDADRKAKLASYRSARASVHDALISAFMLCSAALIANDDQSVTSLLTAAAAFKQAVDEFEKAMVEKAAIPSLSPVPVTKGSGS